jgi:predicted AAA+ superfamily ATPase
MTGTSYYGDLFEQYIILESKKLASYFKPEFRFSYLQTKDGNEVDLVVDRPGQPHLFIEIKSSTQVTQEQLTSFSKITNDFGNCEAVCFSNDPYPKQIGNITVMPWRDGIKKYFS